MQAELKVLSGKQKNTTIPLTMKKFLIGREADCHLRPNTDLVSRHHCVITVDDFSVRVRDLGSTNGTMVNGERITGQVVVDSGDRIDIGNLAFEVLVRPEEAAVAAPAETAPIELDDSAVIPPSPTGVYSGDTIMLPAYASENPPAEPQPPAVQPVQMVPEQPAQQPVPQQPVPQQAVPQQPVPQQMVPQQMMPQQMMPQQMMPQQMMPQQMMPMMPQQPMPVMYPQQPGYPPQGYPVQQPGYVEPQPVEETPSAPEMPEVTLPSPEETGASDVEIGSSGSPAASADGESKEELDPRSAAADIIRQHTHRRPN